VSAGAAGWDVDKGVKTAGAGLVCCCCGVCLPAMLQVLLSQNNDAYELQH
jgi:hypothetical protein